MKKHAIVYIFVLLLIVIAVFSACDKKMAPKNGFVDYTPDYDSIKITQKDINNCVLASKNGGLWLDSMNDKTVECIIVPEGVTAIGVNAFAGCDNVRYIRLPSTLKEIWGSVACAHVSRIVIPAGVKYISNRALGWKKLVEVRNLSTCEITIGLDDNAPLRVYSDGESWLSTSKEGFVIFDDGKDKILVDYLGSQQDIVIPDGITKIGQFAFEDNDDVVSVSIPNSIEYIGEAAFIDCGNLKSIKMSSNIKEIDGNVFLRTIVTTVELPLSIERLVDGFRGTSVEEIHFEGTINRWQEVFESFHSYTAKTIKVVCSDGVVYI